MIDSKHVSRRAEKSASAWRSPLRHGAKRDGSNRPAFSVGSIVSGSRCLLVVAIVLGGFGQTLGDEPAPKAAAAAVAAAEIAAEPVAPVAAVIAEVEKRCLDETIYMIGPERAKRLAELVRQRKPKVVVECGTAIGYSSLWIARELEKAQTKEHQPKLITIEIDPQRAKDAQEYFRRAKLDHLIEIKVGDAKKVVRELQGPIDFVFIDCNGPNYFGCIDGLKDKLSPGAVIVADNAGISAASMKDYLDFVRKHYESRTEWFDMDLPWGKRDAMEISIVPRQVNPADKQ